MRKVAGVLLVVPSAACSPVGALVELSAQAGNKAINKKINKGSSHRCPLLFMIPSWNQACRTLVRRYNNHYLLSKSDPLPYRQAHRRRHYPFDQQVVQRVLAIRSINVCAVQA
jgi:hypothetical protein